MAVKHSNPACRGYGSRSVADTSRALHIMLRVGDAGFATDLNAAGSLIRVEHFTPSCPECASSHGYKGDERSPVMQARRDAVNLTLAAAVLASIFLLRSCNRELEAHFNPAPPALSGVAGR